MKQDKLKPCPFCGGDANFREYDDTYIIKCKECCAKCGNHGPSVMCDTEEDVIKMWNAKTYEKEMATLQIIINCLKREKEELEAFCRRFNRN